jgi:hypothetical protein
MNAVAATGVPIAPSSRQRRAVCVPVPSTVSGAQPTRTPAASAADSTRCASEVDSASGFSPYTCLPAPTADSATAACACGIVRFSTRSTSSAVYSSSGRSIRTPGTVRAGSRSAAATSDTPGSRGSVSTYWRLMLPMPTSPTLSASPTADPS